MRERQRQQTGGRCWPASLARACSAAAAARPSCSAPPTSWRRQWTGWRSARRWRGWRPRRWCALPTGGPPPLRRWGGGGGWRTHAAACCPAANRMCVGSTGPTKPPPPPPPLPLAVGARPTRDCRHRRRCAGRWRLPSLGREHHRWVWAGCRAQRLLVDRAASARRVSLLALPHCSSCACGNGMARLPAAPSPAAGRGQVIGMGDTGLGGWRGGERLLACMRARGMHCGGGV